MHYLLADVQFLPISGLIGTNMKTRVDKSVCSWWGGPCLFEALDATEIPQRDPKGPFRCDSVFRFHYFLTKLVVCSLSA